MKLHTANYVLPVTADAIEHGGVVINDRYIEAVGEASYLAANYPNAEVVHHREAAILPGFVNCHCHLELTAFRGALDEVEHDFRSWLLRLNDLRSQSSIEAIEQAAALGALEGARAGVTCFGDIGRNGSAGVRALVNTGLRGIVFQETEFSPDDRTADDDFSLLLEKFDALAEKQNGLVRIGLSPHSPYTVSSKLFRLIADHSISHSVPISIHAAESADESKLMMNGRGFFVDVYRKFGFEWNSPRCSSVEYLDRLGVLSARPLLAHCVRASGDDINRIARSGSAIAHCPKSNAKFGHGPAPLEAFLNAGITVGLGSDSVASNNTCDMLEEGRFAVLTARNRNDCSRFISAKEALTMATVGGAKALGLEGVVGSLEPGKEADIVILGLGESAQRPINDIYSTVVFSSSSRDVRGTMVAGSYVYKAS